MKQNSVVSGKEEETVQNEEKHRNENEEIVFTSIDFQRNKKKGMKRFRTKTNENLSKGLGRIYVFCGSETG